MHLLFRPRVPRERQVIAGFAAFTNHNAYLPHSGAVLGAVGDAIAGYEHTLSSLHFPVGETLPDELVARLVQEKRDILARGR